MQAPQKTGKFDALHALILGAGAIGTLYGHVLSRAGAKVSVVCRSDHELIAQRGYHFKSPHLGDATFRPTRVLKHTNEWSDSPPDLLIVTMKVLTHTDQLALMRAVVGPSTCIVLIQNGIEIEAPVKAAFPDNEVVSALAFVQVSRTGPAQVEHFSYGELTVGSYPKGIGSGCLLFAQMLAAGGLPGKVTDDVVNARWQKCLWNAPFNPVSALTGPSCTHTMLNTEQGESLIRALMQEVFETAAAAGHQLPADIIDQYIAATKAVPPYKTSMALDAQNQRPMETEAILGNTVRIARRYGVVTPKLDMLYALMKTLEQHTAEMA